MRKLFRFCSVFGAASAAVILLLPGCEALNPRPPIEAFANKLADEAIIPAVRQGLINGANQIALQAAAQGINPTYAMEFEGLWVTGLKGRATVGVEGLAGQVQVTSLAASAAQSTQSPVARPEATTQPFEETP